MGDNDLQKAAEEWASNQPASEAASAASEIEERIIKLFKGKTFREVPIEEIGVLIARAAPAVTDLASRLNPVELSNRAEKLTESPPAAEKVPLSPAETITYNRHQVELLMLKTAVEAALTIAAAARQEYLKRGVERTRAKKTISLATCCFQFVVTLAGAPLLGWMSVGSGAGLTIFLKELYGWYQKVDEIDYPAEIAKILNLESDASKVQRSIQIAEKTSFSDFSDKECQELVGKAELVSSRAHKLRSITSYASHPFSECEL